MNKKFRTISNNRILIPLLIMLASMAVRAFYVSYISIYQNQHDGGVPYSLQGHVGYITWFLENWRLPDFDVRTADQFWHPPLSYALSALLLKAVWTVFPSTNGNIEIAQLLPYLYVTVAIFLIWRILVFFAKEGHELIVNLTLAFVAFQPGLIIRSAMLNNDALVLVLSILALGLAIQWYYSGSWKTMIGTAISFGLAMMAKKSGAIVALPIAILFIGRFVGILRGKSFASDTAEVKDGDCKGNKKNIITRVLLQLAAFLIIAAPIALWWYIRNYALYGVPFDFFWNIQNGWEYEEYLGNIPALTRITDFDPGHFYYANTYLQYKTNTFQDINPLIVLWKSAVSDVWSWTYENNKIKKLSYILLISRTILVLLGTLFIPVFVAGDRTNEEKENDTPLLRVSFVSLFVALIISYYSFCFQYPYVWTMDYRYIEIIIMCDAIFLMTFLARIKRFKVIMIPVTLLIAGFCITSCTFFVLAKGLFGAY